MTQYYIQKSILGGKISIPPSKSQTLRAILFGAMGTGTSVITRYLHSPDTMHMVNAFRLLGASIEMTDSSIVIEGLNGKIISSEDVINAGNSGIVLRFCTAIAALASRPIVITGDYSIRHYRPMQPLLTALENLGVEAISTKKDGYAPIIIKGPLNGGITYLTGEDSQPVSALLIASAFAKQQTQINVINPGEKPWVNLTLDWFQRLGIAYTNDQFKHFLMQGNSCYQGFNYTVASDLSSAAFPIAAAIITNSSVTIENIDVSDPQGDKEFFTVLQKMGAHIEIDSKAEQIHVHPGSQLKGTNVDVNAFIDALPILAVVACFAEGETIIHNAAIARHKECNRIHCIVTELKKMGAIIEETDDGLIVKKSTLKGTTLHSYQDHRMAMALAVAALGASGESIIQSVDCVSKTFPSFSKDFQSLGAYIK